MTDYIGEIFVDLGALQATFLHDLKRIALLTSHGYRASEAQLPGDHTFPDVFFKLDPAPGLKWDASQARDEFRSWNMARGLSEAIEAVKPLLDKSFEVCCLTKFGMNRHISGAQWNAFWKQFDGQKARFESKGLPEKLAELRSSFRPMGSIPLEPSILSVNRARNCLVHRYGKVSAKDLNNKGKLTVKWIRGRVSLVGRSGVRTVDGPTRVSKGDRLEFRTLPAEKSFARGTRVEFSSQEFTDICLTLMFFSGQVVDAVASYGRAIGVPSVERAKGTGPLPNEEE